MNQSALACPGLLPLGDDFDVEPLKPLTDEEIYGSRQVPVARPAVGCTSSTSCSDFATYKPRPETPHYGRIACMWLFAVLAVVTFFCTHCVKCALFVSVVPLLIAGDLASKDWRFDKYNAYAFLLLILCTIKFCILSH